MSSARVRLHVGQGTHRGPLTLFPIWTDEPNGPVGYTTGAQAPVEVTECPDGPEVDRLVITNRGDRPALLLGGELLEGGWQHRALAASTLLAPGRSTAEPVFCIEQGRWSGGATHGRQARRAPAAVLARFDGEHAQHRVWQRVQRYDAVAGSSPTGSLGDRLDRTTALARQLTDGLRPLAGQRGILIGIAGRAAWLEVFDAEESLAAHWKGLLHAATLDALGRPALRTPAASARQLAERVESAPMTCAGPAGLGLRLRGRGRLRVDAVRWDDRTVHLTALDLTHVLQEA